MCMHEFHYGSRLELQQRLQVRRQIAGEDAVRVATSGVSSVRARDAHHLWQVGVLDQKAVKNGPGTSEKTTFLTRICRRLRLPLPNSIIIVQ
jgi:hypothetical protein